MSILAKAIQFASEKHLNQIDKGGHPYILHPLRIMMRLRTSDEELMAIAVLHDVMEDCGVTTSDLADIGMPWRVIEGVNCLTMKPGQTYESYIESLRGFLDALLVKREDLRDNSDITRLKGVSEKDVLRMQKYMLAFKRVEEMIREFR